MNDLMPSEVVNERRKELLRSGLDQIISDAERWGMVVTVSQKPIMPPAMGRYETVVEIRERMKQ